MGHDSTLTRPPLARNTMNEQLLAVTGMTCQDCARHVERELQALPTVLTAEVAYPQAVARIRSSRPLRLEEINALLPKRYRVVARAAPEVSPLSVEPSFTMPVLESTLTCPACGAAKVETMPTEACQYFYECTACHTLLRPKSGDCCVFCSYGSVPCPPKQMDHTCCSA